MSATTFAQHLLTGISLGGAYALIAIGYTMVYGDKTWTGKVQGGRKLNENIISCYTKL